MLCKLASPESLAGLSQLTQVLVCAGAERSEAPFCGRINWWCWFLLAEGLVFLGISEDCWCIWLRQGALWKYLLLVVVVCCFL